MAKRNKPNVKLLTAAEEIKEVLRKHDIAALVSLHTPGHGEYFMHMNPSYSCVYQYEDHSVRINSKKENYDSLEEQMEHQRTTANMLKILSEITTTNLMNTIHLSKRMDHITNAKHTNNKN